MKLGLLFSFLLLCYDTPCGTTNASVTQMDNDLKIFVSANNKGGVGKTSTSALFAEYASYILNKKVLGIDLDSQCNFSQRYLTMESDPIAPEGWIPPIHPDYEPKKSDDEEYVEDDEDDWDGRSSIAGIFNGEGVVPYPTPFKNFDIAPAHAHLLLIAEQIRREEIVIKIHNRLKEFLSGKDVKKQYELIVIDTAPSKGPLTTSALRCATHILIPTIMEDKSIKGVSGMLQLWMQETTNREVSNPLQLVGILANLFDSKLTLHNDIYNSLAEHRTIGEHLLIEKLGRRVAFAENDVATPSPRSIFDLPDNVKAKQEAIAVCERIAEKVFA